MASGGQQGDTSQDQAGATTGGSEGAPTSFYQQEPMSQQVPLYYQPSRAPTYQQPATFTLNGQTYFNPYVSNTPAPQAPAPQARVSDLLTRTQQYNKGYADQLAAAQAEMQARAQAAIEAKAKADAEAKAKAEAEAQLARRFGLFRAAPQTTPTMDFS